MIHDMKIRVSGIMICVIIYNLYAITFAQEINPNTFNDMFVDKC